tara:strand:+ start:7105 stop:7335 length:231 start_codon:yes stop_codon:yes gene_type:complete
MGRAISMETDIVVLKQKVEKLENIVRGMTHTVSERKQIDLIEETKPKESDEKKETNDEGSDKSSVKSNRGNKKNKS